MTLFIGNLTPQWTDVERLRAEMGAHGSIERAAVLRNAQGASKVPGCPRPQAVLRCPASAQLCRVVEAFARGLVFAA